MAGFEGYRGASRRFLESKGMEVGAGAEVATSRGDEYRGIVMPRYEGSEGDRLVLKLGSGYNVGIEVDEIVRARAAEAGSPGGAAEAGSPGGAAEAGSPGGAGAAAPEGLPEILLLSTGGTIASTIDYRTGAVTPAATAGEITASVPELAGIARIAPRMLFSEYSENLQPEHWVGLAREIDAAAGKAGGEYAGVMVAHGTDTMQYTASYVSFALAGLPVPVAFVGSQRSPDRPSSDAPLNLAAAARLLASGKAGGGVYIVMHGNRSDAEAACHEATRARKSHTSRRDAFRTIGGEPAFTVGAGGGGVSGGGGRGGGGGAGEYRPRIRLDARAALVKYHPGYDPAPLEEAIGAGRYRAVIFEGTGLGHVGRTVHGAVRRAAAEGVFVGMTSQCIEGRVGMTVYESGRDLLAMGVVPLRDMIPETALVKAMWALGVAGENDPDGVERLMLENVASEISD